MNESFNSLVQAHKDSEVRHARDQSLDFRTHRKPFSNNFPRIGCQLFDTEGEALAFNVHPKHLGFNQVAFFIQFRRVLDFLAPMKVRNMNQTIDAFFYTYENAKIREVSNRSLDDGSDWIFFLGELPGVGHNLFQSQGNTTVAWIYVEDDNLDILSNLEHFGRMGNFSGPRHFRNMDEPFDPALQLNKSSIVHQTDDFALHPSADGISIGDGMPGVRSQLFHTKGDAFLLGIELQHHNFYFLSHLHKLGRVIDPPPGHVADGQDSIDPATMQKSP